jgi:Domain of unknown function (DUF4440)
MKTLCCLLLLHSFAYGFPCPQNQAKDEATSMHIENTRLRAVGQHDTAMLGCILADEFEEANLAGSLISRSEMLAGAENRADVRYELSEMHARVYGDFAYVRGMGVASQSGQPAVKSPFTDIFRYREGRWQCAAGHESHFPNS